MGSRSRKKTPAPKVATGIEVPLKKRKTGPSRGVTGVRRPERSSGPRPRTLRGFLAAEASALFGRAGRGGGAAFTRWLQAEKGMRGDERLSAEDWAPLLKAFAERPIHGHRRTQAGDNHRINKIHRR